MRILIFTFLLALTTYAKGQAIIADPALKQIDVKSTFDPGMSASTIPQDFVIKLDVPIFNLNINNMLPSGSCKVKIGLGSKIILDPQFNLSSLPSSAYFNWTYAVSGGQGQIVGDLKTNLPANYSNTVTFDVIGNIQGNSTITTNFLVTNHNTSTILSDQDPTNNTSFLSYTIAASGPLPVYFKGLSLLNKECSILVDFYTENEINISKYEIEFSKDGRAFTKTGEITAATKPHYQYKFAISESTKAKDIFFRIKAIDKDNSVKYSETKSVKGLCDNEWAVSVYPNPANAETKITINSNRGSFNGKYDIHLLDMTGRLVMKKEISAVNVNQLKLETGNLSKGQYFIQVENQNRGESSILKWQKN